MAMSIVHMLNTSSAGNIIFTHCHFNISVVRQVTCRLHQPLPERSVAHQHRTIHILQRPADDLGCRCRTSVNEHHHGNDRIDRIDRSTIRAIPLFDFASRRKDLPPLRHEIIHDLNGTGQQPSAIIAQVENQRGNLMTIFQVFKSLFHLLRTLFLEPVKVDVSRVVTINTVMHNLFKHHLFTYHFEFTRFLFARTLNFQYHLRVGNAFEQFAYLLASGLRNVCRINAQNPVTGLETGQSRRHPFERFGDDYSPVTRTDISPYSAVFTGDQHFHIVHLLLGKVFRVRIQTFQHGIDATSHHLIDLDRVNVKHIDFFHQCIENLQLFTNLKTVPLLSVESVNSSQCQQKGKEQYIF